MVGGVADVALANRLPCQVAVEELMACGLGVCWTCAVPLIASDGQGWWNVRACVEGPVFNGARVWWGRWLSESEAEEAAPEEAFEAVLAEPEPVEAGPR